MVFSSFIFVRSVSFFKFAHSFHIKTCTLRFNQNIFCCRNPANDNRLSLELNTFLPCHCQIKLLLDIELFFGSCVWQRCSFSVQYHFDESYLHWVIYEEFGVPLRTDLFIFVKKIQSLKLSVFEQTWKKSLTAKKSDFQVLETNLWQTKLVTNKTGDEQVTMFVLRSGLLLFSYWWDFKICVFFSLDFVFSSRICHVLLQEVLRGHDEVDN